MKFLPQKLRVFINFGGAHTPLGQIIKESKKYYFQYSNSYLEHGHNISPFKLKFDNSVQITDTDIFEGLYGVSGDSQPDGRGRLLMDRFLLNKGYLMYEIDPLLRLSLIGSNGIGALTYRPLFEKKDSFHSFEDLENLYRESIVIYDNETSEIDKIFSLGGSSGGARPKIWINYVPKTNTLSTTAVDDSSPWIIKFPSSTDISGIASMEYIYYQLALNAGISMSECRLIPGKAGTKFFGTKRFDIQDSKRLHMIWVAGLLHDTYRMSNLDYGHLMDAAFALSKNVKSYEEVLRLAVFNMLSNNKDDHSKNFSYLMNANGQWTVSPAYDLTYSTSSYGYQSTTVDGVSKDIKYEQFNTLAKLFGVKKFKDIVEEVIESLKKFKELAKCTDIPDRIVNLIDENIYKWFS